MITLYPYSLASSMSRVFPCTTQFLDDKLMGYEEAATSAWRLNLETACLAMATDPSLAERALEVSFVVLLLVCELKIHLKQI